MNGFNKVILAGNLTRDPELRYTASGTAICKAGIAVNRKWRDSQTQEMKEDVTFVDWTAFGNVGAAIAEHMRKGSPVLIEGRLHLEQWDDKQTQQKRSKVAVIVESFNFLPDSRGDEQAAPPQRQKPDTEGAMNSWGKPRLGQPAPAAAQGSFGSLPPEEDDIPF